MGGSLDSSVAPGARLFRALLVALGISSSLVATGKCPETQYQISGVITSAGGVPVASASVSVRWKEREHFLAAPEAVSDHAGSYSTLIEFNSYSGNKSAFGTSTPGMDGCQGKLHWVEITVTASGHKDYKGIAAAPLKGGMIEASVSLAKR